MASKQYEKEAAKVRAKSEQEKKKIMQYLQKNDTETAKMYASECIRLNKEANNIQRMAGKLGAIQAKLDSAYRTQAMSNQIKQTLPALNSALATLNKSGVASNMSNFEKVMEDLDVQTEGMTGALDGVMGTTQ